MPSFPAVAGDVVFKGKRSDLLNGIKFWCLVVTLVLAMVFSLYGIGFANIAPFGVYAVVAVFVFRGARRVNAGRGPTFFWSLVFFVGAATSLVAQLRLSGAMVDNSGANTFEFGMSNLVVTFFYFVMGVVAALPTRGNLSWPAFFSSLLPLIAVLPFGLGVLDYESVSLAAGREVSHLTVAQLALALVYLSYSYARGLLKVVVLAIGSATVFLTGSRTAFVLGFVVVFLLLLADTRIAFRIKAFAILAIVFVVVGIASLSEEAVGRMLFLEGLSEDSSGLSRLRQFDVGLPGLAEQLWLGDMNFVVKEFGYIGYYMHNGLSFWQEYGLPIFLIFLMVVFHVGHRIYQDLRELRIEQAPHRVFRVHLALYCLVSVVVSMSFTFKMVWFAIGLYCASYGGAHFARGPARRDRFRFSTGLGAPLKWERLPRGRSDPAC